ncbi:MAG: polymorphic toxin type 28 domain-containing protein, partial [Lachnospiraceae bacterium]|nr:polymorphic toxin type 28 domain-containing protein [Lachnospiraceae bacterium]
AADGSGVISGLAGIGWGSIPALLFGDAGEDFLNSFAKIDRDRLLGNEGGKGVDFDQTKLSRSQQKAIESADNIINDHLKSSDLSAALGDLQGNSIAKPNGGFWNHAQEVKDAYTGLVRAEKTLAGSLQNPNLTPDVRAFIQSKYDSIIKYMDIIEEMFAPYGGIN